MATRAKKSAAKKSAAKKPAAKKPVAQKASAGSLPELSRPAKRPAPTSKSNYCKDHGRLLRKDRTCPVTECRFHTVGDGPLALRLPLESTPRKPKSNFCEDHGRLLRRNRTCPVPGCRYHTKPMPG